MIADKIQSHTVSFGCDPEFFFEKEGKIIGSEKIIDINKGLKAGNSSKFIVDGVQAELNPVPNSCRAQLGGEISRCFMTLYQKIQKDKTIKINFKPTVKITKKELDTLDKKSQIFGCAPSKNTDKKSENSVSVKDPKTYMYRSAGGHIHIGSHATGMADSFDPIAAIMREPERLITIMDIIVGNTCVLLDRDPSNKERRKVYGKAGEFRTPAHGIEYRTLSNFWLLSYPLMSFVMNLSRFSVSILASTMPGRDFEKELLSSINMTKIRKAINENDAELAWDNFQKIKPFIMQYSGAYESFPLTAQNIKEFEFFVSKGIHYWFKEDPLQHWMKLSSYPGMGWENFLVTQVRPKMQIEKTGKTPIPRLLRKKTK